MAKLINMTGQVFGRLTVLSRSDEGRGTHARWLCRCQCGVEKVICGNELRRGSAVSCGCYAADRIREASTIHGFAKRGAKSRAYMSYINMMSRVRDVGDKDYRDYGGRGIDVCDRWAESFTNFFADMGECPPGLTLDRVDNDGNYEPRNCRWAPQVEQQRNRRSTRYITCKGKTRSLAEWAEVTGLTYQCLQSRLDKHGWPVERALTTPLRGKSPGREGVD